MHHTRNALQWVSHSSLVMYDVFLCNMLRSRLAELFLVGVCYWVESNEDDGVGLLEASAY